MKDRRAFKKRFVAIVVLVHVLAILGLAFLAGREGMLGERMKSLTVSLVPKEKIPEPVKPKAEEPKIEIPQPKTSPIVEQSTPHPQKVESVQPVVAPAMSEAPAIDFSDGAKKVITSSDPIELYRAYIQSYLHSQWKTPDNKDGCVQVKISINEKGTIQKIEWPITGTPEWKASVLNVFTQVKSFPKAPPQGFQLTFDIRFDTIEEYEQ